MYKIASVISGWHYPLHFYELLADQIIPEKWEHDMFVISHRSPELDEVWEEKQNIKEFSKYDKIKFSKLYDLDREMYEDRVSIKYLELLGYTYMEEPNTSGDFTNTNQWMRKVDWTQYDIVFTAHDDNYIKRYTMLYDVITGYCKLWMRGKNGIDVIESTDKDWYIISNSCGPKQYHIRLSACFFSKEMMNLIDGHFDNSSIKLSRVGKTDSPKHHGDLSDWNKTAGLFRKFIIENGIGDKVKYLSPGYRASDYLIEAERGFLHYSLSWGDKYKESLGW